jgi:hypothetical protein
VLVFFAGISLPARISAKFAGGAMNYHSENEDELPIFLIAIGGLLSR